MSDLIAALTIFLKYQNDQYPTHCEHDMFSVTVNPHDVSNEDIDELDKLSFTADFDDEYFFSFRFGSC
jgi:hypothetical protein